MNAAQLWSQLTRKSRSNFYYAFLFLPRPRREALYAVYAFCRMVDDAVDLGTAPEAQRRELGRWRAELAGCYDGGPVETPIGGRLPEAVRAYALPRSAPEA